MADDYSDIGFHINDEADFSALHASHPEMLTRRKNMYGEAVELFSPDGRAELWYYENEDGAFGDYAEPGYRSGRSTEVVPWVLLPGAMLEVETGVCPLTVAVPGAFLKPLELGNPCSLELTLFARSAVVYKNADDFNPVIIAIGNESYKFLSRYFGKEYRVVKIRHYSSYINPDA